MFRLLDRLKRDTRGVAMVEFVFAFPILLVTVVGVLEVGRAIHYHQAITEGTRAAVRYLTRVGDPCAASAKENAVSLVITRSLGWANPPMFGDWPEDYSAFTGDPKFEATFDGCDPDTDTLTGDTITMSVEWLYADSYGMLQWIGHAGGLPMNAVHQERYIGL